jgi:soluble lytic murein transglycosylase
MKLARPVLIGTLAFAITSTVLALVFVSSPLEPTPVTNASANPTRIALVSTPTLSRGANETATETTATLLLSDTPAVTPSPTPTSGEMTPLPAPTPPGVSSAAYQQGMILRRNGDYAHAAESFRAARAEKPKASDAREIQFRLGESLWLAGDYTNAIATLNALLEADSNDNLAARSHYFLADMLTKRKSYAQAIEHLRAYHVRTSSLRGEIDAQIGDILLAAGDAPGAIAQYNVALQDLTLTAAQRVDFLEKIGGVHSTLGHPGLAAARLSEAFDLAPDSKTRAEAEYLWGRALDDAQQHAAAISHWQHALAAYPDQEGGYQSLVELVNRQVPVDDLQRGLADYFDKSYGPAIQAFNRYITANPNNNAAALYYAGLAYVEDGQPGLAVKSFDTLLQTYPNDRRAADALYNKARAQDRAGDTDGAVSVYDQFAARYPADSRADDALWKAAESLDLAARYGEARVQYDQLATKYPASVYAPTALFHVGFDYYLSQDYTNAEVSWQSAARHFPNTAEGDQALFWLGKLASARGDNTAAQQYLKQAIKPPRSYYSWRALDLLAPSDSTPSYNLADYQMNGKQKEEADFERWLASWTGGTPVASQLAAAILNDFHFRRGSELAQLDQAGEARLEFEKVNARFKSDPRSLYALAKFYQDSNYFDLSVEAAHQIQVLSGVVSDEELPRYLRELIYPTYYADLIVPYAQRNGVDPALFFALVRQESTYDPLSQSWVGATGLTQVMPPTGLGIARELGVRGYQEGDLLKPYVSIRFGAYFFGQLLRYFDGNIFYAMGGYNGGPGNAKKWVRPDVDVGVEVIHLAESYIYVRTVYSQYNQYLEIYRGK